MVERIQKILARAGFGSRRACEELIAAGRVRVNGQVAVLGDKADAQRDKLLVDGKLVQAGEPFVYIALHKPRGVLSAVTTPDPRPTVLALVDVPQRIYPVGRLDADSEGLILLTNDGDLANRLTHPRYGHEKEYRVLIGRRPDEEQLAAWRRGVVLEDGYRTAPAEVRLDAPAGKGAWLRVVLKEGRKRQIRETGQQIGLPVVRIIRVRIGSLLLGNLKLREWRYLTPKEVAALRGPSGKTQLRPAKGALQPKQPGHRPKKSEEPGHRARGASEKGRHK
jgi:23S rRNA pseudouridine2605 synthase